MIRFLTLRFRRVFWRRFHPLVRAGWFVVRGEGARVTFVRQAGFAMILTGLVVGKRKKTLLYATTVPADHSVRVRVVQNGRTIAAG